jgi:hypothetical protein
MQRMGSSYVLRAAVGIAVSATLLACRPGLGVPSPSPVSSVRDSCSASAAFGFPVQASYPNGVLENQQKMIVGGVGTDRLSPDEPALEYLAGTGLASVANTKSVSIPNEEPNSATIRICRDDGSVIEATMYHPFADNPRPIWAVWSYRIGH